ncbi:MAG: hypothetical protein RL265_1773 [Bacteroidota bacterium]|jgi:hypothetical protein
MGKQIMHSARALFLTFLALEKSKRNNTLYENCAAAERGIMPQQCNPKSRDKICSGAETQRKFYLCDLCAFAVKKEY